MKYSLKEDRDFMQQKIDDLKKDNYSLQREIANYKLYQEGSRRLEGGTTWGDVFSGSPLNAEIDMNKTKSLVALNSGETVLTDKVEDITLFKVGQEITIADDVNQEDVVVTIADGTNLEITPLINNYKKNALVARSTVEVDTVNNVMKFGNYVEKEKIGTRYQLMYHST